MTGPEDRARFYLLTYVQYNSIKKISFALKWWMTCLHDLNLVLCELSQERWGNCFAGLAGCLIAVKTRERPLLGLDVSLSLSRPRKLWRFQDVPKLFTCNKFKNKIAIGLSRMIFEIQRSGGNSNILNVFNRWHSLLLLWPELAK